MSSSSLLRRQIYGGSVNINDLCDCDGVPSISELPLKSGGLFSVHLRKMTPPPPLPAGNRLTKLLINFTVERSFGPVHVIISPESSVGELIKTAVEAYVKEKRRPLLVDASNYQRFQLHYSQFSLESINEEEKLMNLGSRNFFLCSKSNRKVANSLEEECMKPTKSSYKFSGFMGLLL